MNRRFMWIKSSTNFVKARLSHPKDGLSICWIEVKTPVEEFHFVTRRALPYSTCLHHVLKIRKLISDSKTVEIIGNGALKDSNKQKSYSSSWELIKSDEKCIGYFGDCENFEKRHPEWQDWKAKGIDPAIYP
ncbi:MAG: hypothetical protein ACLGHN_07450 [Bacteriovoracia bacterium]